MAFIPLERSYPDPGDLETTLRTLEGMPKTTWVTLDGYHFDPCYHDELRASGHKVVVIDDLAHLSTYSVDMVVNQNLYAGELKYHCDSGTRVLLGTDYALLRREFLAWKSWKRRVPETASKILVTLGGGDPGEFPFLILEGINGVQNPRLQVRMIAGASNPKIDALKEAAAKAGPGFEIHGHVADMPAMMAWADVGVCAGGTTCWEFAFMGLPNLIVVLAENQLLVAEGMGRRGISVHLGWHHEISRTRFQRELEALLGNKERRLLMCREGRKLVDGLGCQRVMEAVFQKNGETQGRSLCP